MQFLENFTSLFLVLNYICYIKIVEDKVIEQRLRVSYDDAR
jgi:hypothetical protein